MLGAVDRRAPLFGVTALGALLCVGAYPPMGDLPMHEGVAALLAHHGDATFSPPGLYELSLGHPQQPLHLLMAALMWLVPSVWAAKLTAVSVTALAGFGIVRALDHLGASRWVALAFAPVLLGWLVHWGFATNLLGLAALAWAIPALDRVASAPTGAAAASATAWLVIVLDAHAAVGLSAICVLVVLTATRARSPRGLIALAPAAAPIVLLAVEVWREQSASGALARAFSSRTLWHGQGAKWRQLPAFVVGRYDATTKIVLSVVALVTLAFLVHASLRAAPSPGDLRERLASRRFALAAALLLLVYFVAPYSMNYGAFLYARFIGPAWLCVVLSVAPPAGRVTWGARVAPVACALACAFALLPEIRRADASHRALAPVLAKIERGSAVATVHFGRLERTPYSPVTLGQRVLAERGGRLLVSFVAYPSSPVVLSPSAAWDEMLLRVYADPGALRPSADLRSLRYVVVHASEPPLVPLLARAMEPDARLVVRSGEWLLFESTYPPRPATAPPLAMPEPPPETLQQRAHAIARGRR